MRWLNRFAVYILLLFVLLILAVGTLLLTPIGVKLAVWGAQKALPALHIENSRGALLNGFSLQGVSFASDGFALSGRTLSLNINSRCLSGPALCVDALEGEGISVTVSEAGPQEESPPSEPVSDIKTPLPLFVNAVALRDVSLDILGTKASWDSLTTAAQMRGNTLTLKPTLWQGIRVALPASEGGKAEEDPTSTANKDPIQLPEVDIPLNIVIERFALKDATLLLPDQQVIHELLLVGDAGGHGVQIKTLLLDAQQGKVTLDGDVSLTGNYPLNLNAQADIRMSPLDGHRLVLASKGDLRALLLDASLDGTLKATLDGSLDVLHPDLPFDARLDAGHLQWPIDSAPEYVLSSSRLTAAGSLKQYRAQLATNATGQAIPDMQLSTQLEGDLSNISLRELVLNTLGGSVEGDADVQWSPSVEWRTALTLTDIQPGMQWAEAEGKVSGTVENRGALTAQGGWQVAVPTLDIDGVFRGEALKLTGAVDAADTEGKGDLSLVTPGLRLSHGPNYLAVNGKVDNTLNVDVALNLPTLSASLPQAKGAISGNVGLSGTLEKPTAAITLSAKSLDWDALASIDSVSVRGSVTPLPLVGGGLLLDANGIRAEGVDISQLSLRLSGDEADQTVSLKVNGKPVGADLSVRGAVDRKAKKWTGQLYSSSLQTPVGPWSLVGNLPVSVDFEPFSIDLGAFCWAQNQSRLCLDKPSTIADTGNAQVSLSEFNLDILQSFLPVTTSLSGSVNAKASVGWAPNRLPTVTAQILLPKGQITEQLDAPLTLGWDKVSLNAQLTGNALQANAQLDLTDNGSVSLEVEMDNLSSKQRALQSTFGIDKVDLSLLAPALGDDTKLTGLLNGRVILNGDLDAPTATGGIKLSAVSLQSLNSPIEITDGQVSLTLTGMQGQLRGDLNTPDGDLQLSGSADWQKLDAWLASLTVKGQRLKVAVPPMVALEVSPDMTLTATPSLVSVKGNVAVPWGRIVVESLPASAVQVSSDVVLLDNELQPITQEKATPLNISANIAVNIGNDVRLEAFGLKTLLLGKLDVASNSRGPSVNGEINLKEGTYRSFGQDLLIKKGQLLFNGPPEQPYLQIEAIRNPDAIEDGVEAGIRVTGPADQPEIQVFSDPAMPQANALSYLVRGRNLDSESDGNAMTSMLISLGLSQSGKLVGEIGQAFGVQDLTLDTSGSGGDEKVEVSGYILPGLQVKYGVGIFTSLPEFTVRYRLLKDLYVEAVSGADNAVDLLYQFSIK